MAQCRSLVIVRHAGTAAAKARHNPKKLLYSLMLTPPFIAPRHVDDPVSALAQVRTVYEHAIAHLRTALERFIAGKDLFQRVRAYCPYVRVRTDTVARADSRLSYGFVAGPGIYETTLTRPDLFGACYLEQFRLLVENHHVSLEVGTSKQPMPVHFALPEDEYIEATMVAERRLLMRDLFDLPDLYAMDDGIANGTFEPEPGEPRPWHCLMRLASITRCTGCAITRRRHPSTSRISYCSPTISSTSTSPCASGTH